MGDRKRVPSAIGHRPSAAAANRPPSFRGIFRDDAEARAVYSEGAGIARAMPQAVAVPADAEDVSAVVAWARATGTPLIPRGSGSSMAGGAIGSGIIVDLSRLAWIGEIELDPPRLWMGPGALRRSVNARAARDGLRFPVDPSSGDYCTIGGMVSTNAAGAHSLRFGATRAWVTALDCVFEDGARAVVRRGDPAPAAIPAIRRFLSHAEQLQRGERSVPQARRVRKESSGYALAQYVESGELVDLLVGSEGTLALFVGVELALTPIPGATSSLLAAFSSLEAAVDGAMRARAGGASACELLDRTFIDFARTGDSAVPVPEDTEAVLLMEVEAATAEAAADGAQYLRRDLLDAGAHEVTLALHPLMERMLWSLRHAASPILAALDPGLASMQFIEDGAVPPERLAEYVRGIRAALAAHGLHGVIFGHASDAHVHVNPLVDLRHDDWRERMYGVMEEVTGLTAALGGTLAGEHGDGRLRAPLLERAWGQEAAALFREVKGCFDPAGILNPGVKVPLEGHRPIETVK